MSKFLLRFSICFWLAALALATTACKPGSGPTQPLAPSEVVDSTSSPQREPLSPTNSPIPPTSAPLAAIVNGYEITIDEYQAELALYKAARGTDLAPEDEKRVLDDLIDQALLAQAAAEQGFVADEAQLQAHTQQLVSSLGGQVALDQWMQLYGYNPGSFQQALKRSVAAAWMRNQVIDSVPKVAEQVHARQVLLYNSDAASQAYQQLQAGNDFGNLALKYDPIAGGDLDWFPQGFLVDEKLNQAAFSLQPGEFSEIIETPAGFHILQVLEKDPQRPLNSQTLQFLQNQALLQWMETHRGQATIQLLLP